MSQTRMLIFLAAAVAIVLAAAMWFWSGNRADSSATESVTETIRLYFPVEQGWVAEESHQVADLPAGGDARAQRVVETLIGGPTGSQFYAPLPAGTVVDGVFVDSDGTCTVELLSDTYPNPPQMGSRQEAEMFASLLRSVSTNVPEVQRMVVLWNGRQPESFGGHLDTTRPVSLDQAWAPNP